MRAFQKFFVTIFISSIGFALEPAPLFIAIEERDTDKMISFFDDIKSLSVKEANKFIMDFYQYYVSQYGIEIFNDPGYKDMLYQYKKIYHSLLEKDRSNLKYALIKHEDKYINKILLCRQEEQEDSWWDDIDITDPAFVGGYEIAGGIIIFFLPFPQAKQMGGMAVLDGIRRICNGSTDKDDEYSEEDEDYP